MNDATDRRTTDNGQRTTLLVIVLLFLGLRVALASVRQPFFDELFTLWIADKPVGELFAALRHDSGPPLYYLLVKGSFALAAESVAVGRAVSLACAVLLLFALLARPWGRTAIAAAALLAAFPPHVYFSGEARGYALAGLCAGLAALRLDRWLEEDDRVSLALATGALVFGASSHYYGVLLFPVPFVLGLLARRRKAIVEGFIGSLGAGVLFAPGFLLAWIQPREATAWFAGGSPAADVCLALGSLQHLGFAAPYPPLFVAPAPWSLQLLSAIVVVLAAIRTPRSARAIRFAAIALVPVALTVLFAAIGKAVYFPVRFESVLALPFAAWIAWALEGLEPRARRVLLAAAILLGVASSGMMVGSHARRAPDPHRSAARWLRENVDPRSTIVASGYAFLEVESQTGASWRPDVIALPEAQGLHPGWRAQSTRERLEQELERLRRRRGDDFIWIGDERSDEAALLARRARARRLYRDRGVVVLAVRLRSAADNGARATAPDARTSASP